MLQHATANVRAGLGVALPRFVSGYRVDWQTISAHVSVSTPSCLTLRKYRQRSPKPQLWCLSVSLSRRLAIAACSAPVLASYRRQDWLTLRGDYPLALVDGISENRSSTPGPPVVARYLASARPAAVCCGAWAVWSVDGFMDGASSCVTVTGWLAQRHPPIGGGASEPYGLFARVRALRIRKRYGGQPGVRSALAAEPHTPHPTQTKKSLRKLPSPLYCHHCLLFNL